MLAGSLFEHLRHISVRAGSDRSHAIPYLLNDSPVTLSIAFPHDKGSNVVVNPRSPSFWNNRHRETVPLKSVVARDCHFTLRFD